MTAPSKNLMLAFLTKGGRSRTSLEKTIETCINTARAHEQNNVPAGHDYYKMLYKDAVTACSAYCNANAGNTIPRLFAQYPALQVLHDMADPPVTEASGGRGGIVVAVLGTVVLSPVIIGVAYALFHFVVKHLGA